MREDITEGKTGVPLRLLLTFVNVNSDCAPITDALVYTWHCDKDGAYSGYDQPGNNTVGETFCRGVQMTDGEQYQLCTMAENASIGGYDAALTVGVSL